MFIEKSLPNAKWKYLYNLDTGTVLRLSNDRISFHGDITETIYKGNEQTALRLYTEIKTNWVGAHKIVYIME